MKWQHFVVHFQVLWEMLTQEVPFKGLLGVQVAWLVVVEGEVNRTANGVPVMNQLQLKKNVYQRVKPVEQ